MNIISLTQAKALGLILYFTGKPCSQGHIAFRRVSNRDCEDCGRLRANARRAKDPASHIEKARAWRRANPEKTLTAVKRWQQAHPEWIEARKPKKNEQARQRYAANPQKLRAATKAWEALHPDRVREIHRNWRGANRERVNTYQRNRHARSKRAEGFHTADDVSRIRKAQGDHCAMPHCRKVLHGKGQIDHIVPIKLGGSNWPRNLQLMCKPCNVQKNAKHPADHIRSLGFLI